jgi:hypothetical protein
VEAPAFMRGEERFSAPEKMIENTSGFRWDETAGLTGS